MPEADFTVERSTTLVKPQLSKSTIERRKTAVLPSVVAWQPEKRNCNANLCEFYASSQS